MKPLVAIYWARLGLGTIAALLSALLALTQGEFSITTFLNGLTVALLVYLVSYYVFKAMFGAKVEKPSKIMTMGIGVYFFTWIVLMILFYTLLHPS